MPPTVCGLNDSEAKQNTGVRTQITHTHNDISECPDTVLSKISKTDTTDPCYMFLQSLYEVQIQESLSWNLSRGSDYHG